MAKIIRYKVFYPGGNAEYSDQKVAAQYGIDMGGTGETTQILYDVPDENLPSAKLIADQTALDQRKAALAEEWPDAFDLLDDILNNGIEAVKARRDAIKADNPKPK